jgi:CHAT domain-containing protein/tetratricopeptide (TPR) repeat protein
MHSVIPESPLPLSYLHLASERLGDAGPAGRALRAGLTRLRDGPADVEVLWPQVSGNRAYWACLRHGDAALAGLAQFALAALLAHHRLDARATLLLQFAKAYVPDDDRQPLRTLFEVCDAREAQIADALQAGMTLHDQGDFAAAIAAYDQVILRWPNAAWPRYEKALSVAGLEGQPGEQTRALLDEVLVRDPFYSKAYAIRSERDRGLLATHIEPFRSSGDLGPALVERFATGAMQLGEHWSAAHARVYLGFAGPDPPPQLLLQLSLVELGVVDTVGGREADGREPASGDGSAARRLVDEATARDAEGDLTAAAEAAARAVALREQGADPHDVARALSIQAAERSARGSPAEGAELLEEALDIWDAMPDARVVDRVIGRNNLASSLLDSGQTLRARRLLVEAQRLWPSMEPGFDEIKIPVLLSRARIEAELGDWVEATMLVDEAEGLAHEHERAVDPLTPARTAEVRAAIARARGDDHEAAAALRRALDEQRRIRGPDHPDNCFLENNLGVALTQLGERDEARRLLDASLAKREAVFGPDSPEVATVLNNQAMLVSGEDPAGAARLLERALAIRRVRLPAANPDRIDTLCSLGAVRAHLGEADGAAELLAEAARDVFTLVTGSAGATEAERLLQPAQRQNALGLLMTIALDHPSRWAAAFEALANTRALSTGLSARRRAFVGRRRPLDEAISHYAALAVRGPRGRDIGTYLGELNDAGERVDAESVREDATAAAEPLPFVTAADVTARLDGTTAFVDLALYSRARLPGDTPQDMLGAAGPAYAATLVSATGVEAVVDLGPATVVDQLVHDFQEEMGLYVNLPRDPAIQAGSAQLLQEIGRKLYDATLGRLGQRLGQFRRLVLSLDGAAALVPYACLVTPDGRYAAELWLMTYLSSVHDLLHRPTSDGDGTIAVFADPAYGVADVGARPGQPPNGRAPFSDTLLTRWTELDGSRQELQDIVRLAGKEHVRAYAGRLASKSSLMEIGSPEVLHLATHGFYVKDSRVAVRVRDGQQQTAIHAGDLLRCGVVLAGVNERRDLVTLAPDDGVVTGLELCTLDLSHTRLAVLSACETAVGSAVAGDAVHGLRRACHLAGAHVVISCLWSVADADSAQVVASLYDSLVHGVPPDQALQHATLQALRRSGEAGHGLPHPYHWAAWVMSGSLASTSVLLSRLSVALPVAGVEVAVGRPKPFSPVEGLERTIYTTAGEHGGLEVFGRGQRIGVTVHNRSPDPAHLVEVALILVSRDAAPGAGLRYDKLAVGVPAIRSPAPVVDRHVRWTDEDQPGTRKVVFDGPPLPVADRCDIVVDVEAAAPGLWEYVVEATIRPPDGDAVAASSVSRLAILLRGT